MAASDDAELELPLKEFISQFTLPQRVKVVEGFYDMENGEDFSAGDVIDLQSLVCPSVTLTIHTARSHWCVTVPTTHPTTFIALPSATEVPAAHQQKSEKSIIKGVKQLGKIFPLNVRVSAPYVSKSDPGLRLEKGDHLKLMRFVRRFGDVYIECKSSKQLRLLLLPASDTEGEFQELQTKLFYTLHDLVSCSPAGRKLKLADDIQNKHYPLPGGREVPADAVIVMERPTRRVKYVPFSSPGSTKEMSVDLDITVSPRQDTYSGSLESGLLLLHFAKDNERLFPVCAVVSDWYEDSAILEGHSVQPGSKLNLFSISEEPAFLAHIKNERFFTIPKSYTAMFAIAPQTYHAVYEIPKIAGFRFRALEDAPVRHWSNKLHGVRRGEVYTVVMSSTKIVKHIRNGAVQEENEVLAIKRVRDTDKEETLNLPLYINASFEEVLPSSLRAKSDLPSLSEQNTDFPISILFDEPTDAYELEIDPLPSNTVVTITNYIKEPCVLAANSTKTHAISTSFHIPLRTQILLTFVNKIKKSTPAKLSPLNQRPQEITREWYNKLKDYERLYYEPPVKKADAPVPPLRVPRGSGEPLVRAPRPPHQPTQAGGKGGGIKGALDKMRRSFSGKDGLDQVPRVPKKTVKPTQGKTSKALPPLPGDDQGDDLFEYSYVALDNQAVGISTTAVTIPDDSNLSNFDVPQMMSFLQQMKVPYPTISKFQAEGINGQRFARFSDADLQRYGIDNPVIKHFRDKSKTPQYLIML